MGYLYYMKLIDVLIESIVDLDEVKLTDREIKKRLKKAKRLAVNFANPYQFKTKYKELFNFLRNYKLLDQVFPGRKLYKPDGYWNEITIWDEASKYGSKSEFSDKNQVAYNRARTLGILDTLFPERKEYDISKKWNIENSTEVAQNFDGTLTQFSRNYPSAYNILKDAGTLHDLIKSKKESESDESVISRAKEYGTLSNLRTNNMALYQKARTRGLLNMLYDEYQERSPKMDDATKQEIIDMAKQYNTKSNLYHNNYPVFAQLKKIENGFELAFGKKGEFKKQDLIKRAKEYNNKYELYYHDRKLFRELESNGLMDQAFPPSPSDEEVRANKVYENIRNNSKKFL